MTANIKITFMVFILLFTTSNSQNMFRADSNHTGFYSYNEITTRALKWKFTTEGKVRSTGVINDNVVYIGSDDNKFYAINTDDGTLKWSYTTGGVVASSAAIKDNTVYFYSKDGELYALNMDDGSEIWSITIENNPAEKDIWDLFLSSPVISNETIFIGSDNGKIYSIDIPSHSINWEFQTGDRIIATPAVDDSTVYIGSFDGYFYALDKDDGSEKWNFDAESNTWSPLGEVQSSATVTDSLVMFATRGEYLYVLNKFEGSLKWKYRQPDSWFVGSPAIDGNNIYIGDSDGHKFHIFDIVTGTSKWVVDAYNNILSSPIVTDSSYYFATGNAYNPNFKGSLICVDKETNSTKWQYMLGSHIWSSPVISDNLVVIGCDDNCIYAFENKETTDIEDNELETSYKLMQNYPNPFNPSSTIQFQLLKSSHVNLTVFDVSGEKVVELINENRSAGNYEVLFKGENCSSGVYFYSLVTDGFRDTKKMVLLK